jgi:hypothetical protein
MHATTSATMRTIVPRVTRSGSSSRASPLAAVAAKAPKTMRAALRGSALTTAERATSTTTRSASSIRATATETSQGLSLPISLKGKRAFVAGVADDQGFGWAISKALSQVRDLPTREREIPPERTSQDPALRVVCVYNPSAQPTEMVYPSGGVAPNTERAWRGSDPPMARVRVTRGGGGTG